MKVCTLASISPQFQPSTMCYVETVYHLVRVSGRTNFDLDARLGRSTVPTCGIGEGRDPGEMKASVHVVTTVCHVRGVGRSRRPCIAVCLRNLLSSRPRPQPALKIGARFAPGPGRVRGVCRSRPATTARKTWTTCRRELGGSVLKNIFFQFYT